VVGVIFNLSVWFILKALFTKSQQVNYFLFDFEYPIVNSIDYYAAAICVIAMILQFKLKKGLFTILGVSTILGILIKFFLK